MCLDDTTVRIPLRARDGSVRAYALVDAADADFVNQWRWHLTAKGYASRNVWVKTGTRERCVTIRLNRLLLGLVPGDGMDGDHIDRDRLNNRRINLRPIPSRATAQNKSNYPNTSSPYRGVAKRRGTRKWVAQVKIEGQPIILGSFYDEQEAADVARAARLRLMPYAVD